MESRKTKLVGISLLGTASLAALGFGGDDTRVETEPIAVAVIELESIEPSEPAIVQPEPVRPALTPTPGAVLAVDRHGLLIVERSAGELVRADKSGQRRASASFGPGLGELVLDGLGHAYLADRSGDRVRRFDIDHSEQPRELSSASVGEPHGLALTPTGDLLITSVNDHALVVLDAETLTRRWTVDLAPEPRAVAVSPDGSQAAVGFLSSGSIALIDLESEGRRIRWQSLEPRDHVETVRDDYEGCYDMFVTRIVEARSRFSVPVETGRRYARNVYALGFAGNDQLFAPHQLATPQMQRVVASEAADSYGGQSADIKPIVHTLARLGGADQLEIELATLDLRVHQPRAMAYDAAEDRLYLAGYGDDRITVVQSASKAEARPEWPSAIMLPDGRACGIDGLALDGEQLWVHCEFGRRVVRFELATRSLALTGEPLAESTRSDQVELGAELFRRSDSRISDGGALACSSCHPEGRSDGLTWRLGKSILQAPVLAGRVTKTGPYKWDGQDKTLHDSLRHTMMRLGGGGPSGPAEHEIDAMVAYLESLPAPKPPSDGDVQAITRGREVFVDASCDACHEGERYTDRKAHALATTLARVDTPSLIGLAHSRPYFHDGSAPDLWTLLTDRGTVHDMADTSDFSDAQLRDLVAYLESL